MKPHFRIIEKQAFIAAVPMYNKTPDGQQTPIVVSTLQDIKVVVNVKGGAEVTDYTVALDAYNNVLLNFLHGVGLHVYSVLITATQAGRPIRTHYAEAFEGVCYNRETSLDNYITDERITLPDSVFVLSANTQQIAQLAAQLQEMTAQAQAARDEYIAKAEALEGVAQQGENTNATNTAIYNKIASIQGEDETANLTDILTLIINEGIPRADEYAQEINETIGDWNNE